jgi:hypothetical protein
LERDLEIERRKNRELQDTTRERDKEYQKLKVGFRLLNVLVRLLLPLAGFKVAHDKFKRKALFPTGTEATHAHSVNASINVPPIADQAMIFNKLGRPNANKTLDVGAVVGGMEANGVRWSISRPPFLISRFTCYRSSERPSSTARYSQVLMRQVIPGRHNLRVSVTRFDPFSPPPQRIAHIVRDMYLIARIVLMK